MIPELQNNTQYYIWVRAGNPSGFSAFSDVKTGTPISGVSAPYAPMSVTVKPGDQYLELSWPAVMGATSYEVWISITNNSSTATKHGDNILAPNYYIANLTNDTTYYVWVKAVNNEGASGFSPEGSGTPAIMEAEIRGLVNSNGSFTVTLVEINKTLYFGNSAYFEFPNLHSGTYHVKIERNGYRTIVEKIVLTANETINIGTKIMDTLLPDGNGIKTITESIDISQEAFRVGASKYMFSKSFRITATREVTVSYNFVSCLRALGGTADDGLEFTVDLSGNSNSKEVTFPSGNYAMTIHSSRSDEYIQISYEMDSKAPRIQLSKTWVNSNQTEQVAIDCFDNVTGVQTARYAITNSMDKPTSFTTIPINTAVQFNNNGIWFLHVEADDNEIPTNTSYRMEGPFIIKK